MKTIQIRTCKKRLAILWFTLTGIIFSIFLIQFLNGVYETFEKQSWNWLVQNIFPTLSLIVSIFVIDTLRLGNHEREVEKFYFRIAFIISFFYLLSILFVLLYRPFTEFTPIGILEASSLWLAPCQGIVTASLGIFFFKKAESVA